MEFYRQKSPRGWQAAARISAGSSVQNVPRFLMNSVARPSSALLQPLLPRMASRFHCTGNGTARQFVP